MISLKQAEIDRAYMDGVLDCERAVDDWIQANIRDDAHKAALINGLMKALFEASSRRVPEERLNQIRKLSAYAGRRQ